MDGTRLEVVQSSDMELTRLSVAWLSPVGDYELLADDISNFKLDTLTQTQQKYS